MAKEDFFDNHTIQKLLTKVSEKEKRFNSVIQSDKDSGKLVKIQNLQALIDKDYSHFTDRRLLKEGRLKIQADASDQSDKKESDKLHLHLSKTNDVI